MSKKIAYIGGGGTRGVGTMASFIHHGRDFDGCHIVIVDINEEQLNLVVALARKMAVEAGLNMKIDGTTDLRAGLTDCDFVLTSYRPGGFDMRVHDERLPLKMNRIGQETQGAGGMMMAMRSIHIAKHITEVMREVCPRAILVNYTNPINIVSQAITRNCDIPTISMCEGSITSPPWYPRAVGLDENLLKHTMVGLNHGSWTVEHRYGDQDFMPIFKTAYEQCKDKFQNDPIGHGLVRLAMEMDALPNHYFQYYYLEKEWLKILKNKGTTRAEDILKGVPSFWQHYREQLETKEKSQLDPRRSRGGIHELELALDLIAAIMHNRRERMPVNVPNKGAIIGLDDDIVVEVPAFVDGSGVTALPLVRDALGNKPFESYKIPKGARPLLYHLAEYQSLAADAAWNGTRRDAIVAMAANPLVRDFSVAEKLYDKMSAAQAKFLPARLLKD